MCCAFEPPSMPSRRNILRATVSAAALGLLAGCGQSDTSPASTTTVTTTADPTMTGTDGTSQTTTTAVSADALTSRTKTIVERLADGEYATVVDEYEFTPAVSRQLDADALESAWKGQTKALGPFVE